MNLMLNLRVRHVLSNSPLPGFDESERPGRIGSVNLCRREGGRTGGMEP